MKLGPCGTQVIEQKHLNHSRSLWSWPLTYWVQKQEGFFTQYQQSLWSLKAVCQMELKFHSISFQIQGQCDLVFWQTNLKNNRVLLLIKYNHPMKFKCCGSKWKLSLTDKQGKHRGQDIIKYKTMKGWKVSPLLEKGQFISGSITIELSYIYLIQSSLLSSTWGLNNFISYTSQTVVFKTPSTIICMGWE